MRSVYVLMNSDGDDDCICETEEVAKAMVKARYGSDYEERFLVESMSDVYEYDVYRVWLASDGAQLAATKHIANSWDYTIWRENAHVYYRGKGAGWGVSAVSTQSFEYALQLAKTHVERFNKELSDICNAPEPTGATQLGEYLAASFAKIKEWESTLQADSQ